MIPAFSPFLALRYLWRRRINLLGIAGVAFAVWATLVVDAIFNGFVSDIHADVRRSASDLMVTDLPHETSFAAIQAALVDPDVLATAPRLRHYGLLQPRELPDYATRWHGSEEVEFDHTENGFALLVGIDPLLEPQVTDLADWLARGPAELRRHLPGGVFDLPASSVLTEPDPERRAEMLLPDDVEWRARRRAGMPVEPREQDHRSAWPGVLLGWPRIRSAPWVRQGDPFDVLCASFVGARGQPVRLMTNSVRTAFAGWFCTGNRRGFDDITVLVPIETLRSLVGQDALDPLSVDVVSDVVLRVRPGLTGTALSALQQRLQERVQAVLPPASPPCAVLDWQQQYSVFLSAVAQEQSMMQLVLFVVMLVSAFVIYATLHMMVVQKVKDIGILAALGGTPRGIGAVFLLTGGVVGGLGALFGVLAGILSVQNLNAFNGWLRENFGVELFPSHLFDLAEIPVQLTPGWVLTVALGAAVLALLVAFVPARTAARMHPVTALSYE